MLGFVFVTASPRYISPEAAQKLIAHVDSRAQCVGLFGDEHTPDHIIPITDQTGIHTIQLHGLHTPNWAPGLRAMDRHIMVARGIATADDVRRAENISADMLLFDAKPPTGEIAQGGHGAAFDWAALKAYEGNVPWLLAGGLTPENVGEAIGACCDLPQFTGVDVSSGVEKVRGEKDNGLIRAFVQAARAAMAPACDPNYPPS